jgi:DNA recombination protein RmuC
VASVWKAENSNRNTLEIARQAGDMYDKFVGFADNLVEIGKSIKKAEGSYDDALKKLRDGKGSLVSRAEKLKSLGIKANKNLPPAIAHDKEDDAINTVVDDSPLLLDLEDLAADE